MQVVQQYRVLTNYSSSGLEESVIAYLEKGWVLHGGIAIAANDGGSIKSYAQAMVKVTQVEQ